MKELSNKISSFFVDESGDPTFYDRYGNLVVGKEGCSKILILGFIRTEEPARLRSAVLRLRDELAEDPYLRGIPSFGGAAHVFHAKDDCPEVREKFYKTIVELPFKAQFFVARKTESIFRRRHHGSPTRFYDDLITKLFENQLHTSTENLIYFATRGNRARQEPLHHAIEGAVALFEKKWGTKVASHTRVLPQTPVGEPCIQIIDYMNWAIFRAFTRGDMRFFNFVRDHVSFLVDVYDVAKYPENYYTKKNPFDVKKISPV